ncbi:MAG TPA: RHS repeat-associated core domain-containing protein [Rugosimonospora sp.]|nr:RHS repeat-associated core domain-containing protein [Rugosimonospora sp.]
MTLHLHAGQQSPGAVTATVGRTAVATSTAPDGTAAVTVPAAAATTAVTFAASAPVSVFGTANPFSADPASGSLNANYPLDVPAGPGGLSPRLALDYSSAMVSEQHNPMAAAGWVGEGWNLSLGQISWKEDLNAQYWENSWFIQDPYGLADDLVPPNVTVSTYYDDKNGSSITAGPIQWHTATESHAKIYSYTGPLSLPGMSAKPPCFRVFLPNGIMEEFGCTMDSLRYYPSGSKYFVSGWLLDLIADRSGNQIHVTYQQDMAKGGSSGSMAYPRDTVLSTVEWDAPGTTWAPLMRVSFQAAHAVSRFTGTATVSNKNGCNALPMRCDDPWYTNPPLQQQTFVLNDALVQVRGSATASWNTLRDYQFTYQQTGVHQFQDPWTGQNTQAAGQLDLTAFREVGADGSTALPARTFTYTQVTEEYTDLDFAADPGPTVTFPSTGGIVVTQVNCGPSWNWAAPRFLYNVTDVNGAIWSVYGCVLWSQSYANNSDYLAGVSNGLGLAQTFTWANAHPNVSGVMTLNGQNDPADPLWCNGHESTYPCGTHAEYQEWSRAVLTQQSNSVVRASTAGNQTVTSTTSYRYRLTTPVPAQPGCSSTTGRCFVATMYWRPLFHFNPADFNNERFMGFAEVDVTNPDGSVEKHHYYTTQGIGVYDTAVPCKGSFCHASAWWNPANALHGREYTDDVYDTDGSTLLSEKDTKYSVTCPPAGVAGSPSWKDSKDTDSGFPYTFTWDGQLVTEVSNVDPVAVCDIQVSQVDTYTRDGQAATAAVPHSTTTYGYDSYGRVVSSRTTGNDGSATTVGTQTTYVWNDAVTATGTGVTGTYLIDFPATQTAISADGSRHLGCVTFSYDGQPAAQGQNGALVAGRLTRQEGHTSCGTSANGFTAGGAFAVSGAYDARGGLVGVTDADGNAGDTAHTGCALTGASGQSVCVDKDPVYGTYSVTGQNALGQTVHMGYSASTDATGGFGTWPVTQTDLNGQVTRLGYDGLGRETTSAQPGETAAWTSAAAYADWCGGTAAQAPCVEIDHTSRVDAATTTVSRTFYDGFGRPVETRSTGSGGHDTVTYTYYDPMGRPVFTSSPYLVAAYSGAPGAAAFAVPDASQPGGTTAYLSGRSSKVTNATSGTTLTTKSVVCGIAGTTDTACYTATSVVDPLGHQQASYSDAFGHTVYTRSYTGTGTYSPYATTVSTYDEAGNVTKVVRPDGATSTTYTYDDAGQLVAMTDSDRGTEHYAYDADGNRTEVVDARGATTFTGYDALGRPLWRNTTNSATGAYATYQYDSTANGNPGLGHLTGEAFSGGGMTGSRSYTYDARGRETGHTLTVNGSRYSVGQAYDDAGDVTTLTYPDGEVVTNTYASGVLSTVSLRQPSGSTTLLDGAVYDAAGDLTGASLANGAYHLGAAYDLLGRLVDTGLTRVSDSTVLFDQARTFDGAGNVTSATTTLPQGTDRQQFCYDDQYRLTWAGSTGTPACTGTAITATTLSAGAYNQAYTYDVMDRLTSGPLGAYQYTDPAHPDAPTQVGTGYTASYDAAGDLTCRAVTNLGPCAVIGYDNEGRMSSWQDAPTAPTRTATELYDPDGTKVAQQVTGGDGTSTVVYVDGLEEVTNGPSGTTTTAYFSAGGQRIALSVNGVLSYLGSDGLGSTLVALDGAGNVTAAQLYTPYGTPRFRTGTMPDSHGYTGQRADPLTGLIDDSARQLDPLTGEFTSADSTVDGPDRYAYVHDNPATLTDPSGHDTGEPGPPERPDNNWGPAQWIIAVIYIIQIAVPSAEQFGQFVDAMQGHTTTPTQTTTMTQTGNHGNAEPTQNVDDSIDPKTAIRGLGKKNAPSDEEGGNRAVRRGHPTDFNNPWESIQRRWGLPSVQISQPVPVIETFPITPSMGSHVLPQPPPPPPALVQPPVTTTPITPPVTVGNTSVPNSTSVSPITPVISPPILANPIAPLQDIFVNLSTWYQSLPAWAQIGLAVGAITLAVAAILFAFPELGVAVAGFLFDPVVEFAGAIGTALTGYVTTYAPAAYTFVSTGVSNAVNDFEYLFNRLVPG